MTDAIARPLRTPSCRGTVGQLDLPLLLPVVATCLPRPSSTQRVRIGPRPWPRPQHQGDAVQLVIAFPAKPRRHRPVNPHAKANALALQHRDIAAIVAGNISRRTGHPKEDLEQIAMLGIIQAARRYSPERGAFRPYARTYANGEVYHYLRDKGFLIKVPASWRELYARGLRMQRLGHTQASIQNALNLTNERWRQIVYACTQRVVSYEASHDRLTPGGLIGQIILNSWMQTAPHVSDEMPIQRRALPCRHKDGRLH